MHRAGFGLKCAPILHKIFTACGIKDISAKFYGSHNHMQTIKAMAHILHGGVRLPFVPSLRSSTHRGQHLSLVLLLLKRIFGWLQANPKGLGDGIGGPARTSDKGRGMRHVRELEIERGRYGVEVGNRQTRF